MIFLTNLISTGSPGSTFRFPDCQVLVHSWRTLVDEVLHLSAFLSFLSSFLIGSEKESHTRGTSTLIIHTCLLNFRLGRIRARIRNSILLSSKKLFISQNYMDVSLSRKAPPSAFPSPKALNSVRGEPSP